MAIHLPMRMLVLIAIGLILLFLGLAAIAIASGMTLPVFDQIADLLGGLGPSGG